MFPHCTVSCGRGGQGRGDDQLPDAAPDPHQVDTRVEGKVNTRVKSNVDTRVECNVDTHVKCKVDTHVKYNEDTRVEGEPLEEGSGRPPHHRTRAAQGKLTL